MKKSTQLVIAMLALPFAVWAQQNIGIGTKDPQSKLHIVGGTDASVTLNGFILLGVEHAENMVIDNNEILARNNGQVATLFLGRDGSMVQIGNSTLVPGTKLYITSGSDLDLTDANSGFLVLGSIGSTNIAMDNNEIQARNNESAANLTLQHNGGAVHIGNGAFENYHHLGVTGNAVVTGNMRVGTAALPGGYSFGVDGKIICTEVMVRLVANWPDYVFSDNYQLKSLQEVERFIKQHKHLPGIPAATDLENNGLTLGAMQKLQMEKIEELTLYVIDLEKKISKLERALDKANLK